MKPSLNHPIRGRIIKILFIHLLNDYSGSPKILMDTIFSIHHLGVNSKLLVGRGTEGFLSNAPIEVSTYWYLRTGFKVGTLFTYFFSQLLLFFKLLLDRSIDKDAVIFINTLLPFGAAIYGKLTGKKVVYHVHEISVSPAPLKLFLTSIVRWTSSLNIYVSDTHMQSLPIAGVSATRIYNALDADFYQSAINFPYVSRTEGVFHVLLIASLRDYKGIPELLQLVARCAQSSDIRFHLVVNDEQAAIDRYFAQRPLPANLTVYPRTTDTRPCYQQAQLVLNLSHVDQWVETFGLTVLEAMAFGIPVIVPPVGGPAELVHDGVEGYLVDSYDMDLLAERVMLLYDRPELCLQMSQAARERSADFSPEVYAREICAVIEGGMKQ